MISRWNEADCSGKIGISPFFDTEGKPKEYQIVCDCGWVNIVHDRAYGPMDLNHKPGVRY